MLDRIKEYCKRLERSYEDGFYVGGDPIGLVIGSLKKDTNYLGYLIDQYGHMAWVRGLLKS